MSFDDEDAVFNVVVNHEEQYSIWPDYKEIPAGWRAVGKRGSKQECLAHIDAVWTDMRPASLREFMNAQGTRESADGGRADTNSSRLVDEAIGTDRGDAFR
jgi:MbtH protein